MFKMKKIIFPFYDTIIHKFITEKWWSRTLIVLYIIALIAAPFVIWFWYTNGAVWCYESLTPFFRDVRCTQFAQERWIEGIPLTILGTLSFHYIIQGFFFKIVIDFIMLGGKK